MSLPIHLQNYLNDLSIQKPKELSLNFVASLQNNHQAQYSFNNLAVVLGETISLNTLEISKKIVTNGLGGYCFEHNKLTYDLLQTLGYSVHLKLARVLNNQDKQVARTHRITLMDFANKTYLIDTGFGAYSPNAPVLLQENIDQAIGSEIYRIIKMVNTKTSVVEYDLQIIKDNQFYTLYRFDLAHYNEADCDAGHFFSHKYPEAGFVNNLVISLKNNNQVIAIKNQYFLTRVNKEEKATLISDSPTLHSLLTHNFSLTIDKAITDHLFDRFIKGKINNEKETPYKKSAS
ncbi:arylamine N-acetyltransferase family protein [Marinicellulosiphila megalodicopiae]|uniref:arylamine N-acetyltransferase family protein n=1 Tax=Marinicellulosiphila megalodicopiae TaxID=2724896 RepID=UPI003BB098A6